MIPRRYSLRLYVLQDLLKIAAENDEVEVLNLVPADVNRWINEWDITGEQKSELFKSIADTYDRRGKK